VVPLLKYSVLRLVMFVAVLALLAVLRAGPMISIVGAAVVSMMLSYLFLRGPRQEAAATLAERVNRRTAGRAPTGSVADETHEDAVLDARVPDDVPADDA